MRAVEYPADFPVSLASLQLVQGAADTFGHTLIGMVSKVQSISSRLASVRKLYEASSIPNMMEDGTIPFPEDSAQIKYGISLEFRCVH